MFRALHVLLTITALLLCPINCRGDIAKHDVNDEQAEGCRCCHPPSLPSEGESDGGDTQDSEPPAAPEDDCRCASCLCRGAILPDDHPPLDVADVVLELPLVQARATAAGRAGVLRATAGRFPPDVLRSGRLIRFALQSLQV